VVNHAPGNLLAFTQMGGNDHDTWRRPRSESSADAESVYMTNMVIDSGYHGMHSRKSSVGSTNQISLFFRILICIPIHRLKARTQSKNRTPASAASRSGASRGGTPVARTPTISPTNRRSLLI